MRDRSSLAVLHLVEPMTSGNQLWGKERVVRLLMNEQRASGTIVPHLMTLSPSYLGALAAADGIVTVAIAARTPWFPFEAVSALARMVRMHRIDVIHSHCYKANLLARALRILGPTRRIRLVSTCHGWVGSTEKLRLYNTLDRWSAVMSDVTTVPDAAMLHYFPALAVTRHVANGVPDVELGESETLPPIRGRDEFIAGTLGRVSVEKGIADVLAAAAACAEERVAFAIAGVGELSERAARTGGNVRYIGYVRDTQRYLAQLDVYVQASHSEGLSLALLEAMRAGKPIVATDVGATRDAVIDGETGIVVRPGRPDDVVDALRRLKRDPDLAARLGARARQRFESEFRMQRQSQRFAELYGCGSPLAPQPVTAAHPSFSRLQLPDLPGIGR
jgi:glycosyltransferase involved in cell wall biosynthesis